VWYDPRAMRRFVRILVNTATAASLVLFVASVVLWVRSFWVSDLAYSQWIDDQGRCTGNACVQSLRGTVVVHSTRLTPPMPQPGPTPAGRNTLLSNEPVSGGPGAIGFYPRARAAGFGWGTLVAPLSAQTVASGWAVVVPLYAPTLILSVLPLVRLRAEHQWRRTYRRRLDGLCPT
jgi:hypothetical protein